jgi:hypothetical protein
LIYLDDRVPFGLGHVDEHPITQDARIVDQPIQPAERVDRGLDETSAALPVGDVVGVDHRLAAHPADLLDDLVGRARGRTRTGAVAAQVVDDDAGTLAGELERVLAADAAPRPRHDDDPTIHDSSHRYRSLRSRL